MKSSNQGGKKAFQDKNDIEFGWAYLEKLLGQLNEEKTASDGKISFKCRLTKTIVWSIGQLAMSVSKAKKFMEESTLDSAISKMVKYLGITAKFVAN